MLVPASGVVRDKHSFVDRLLYSSFLFLRVSNWEVMSQGQNLFSMIKPEYIYNSMVPQHSFSLGPLL
jgi:hypothetical protein